MLMIILIDLLTENFSHVLAQFSRFIKRPYTYVQIYGWSDQFDIKGSRLWEYVANIKLRGISLQYPNHNTEVLS